jgi:hypothetical protein
MALQQQAWKVHPHGHLEAVSADVLTVTGTINMPAGKLPRRMTVVRVAGQKLIIFSAISLEESEMRRLEEFGQPAFMIVPNDHHRMDARSWRDRYPGIQVISPAGARAKVERVVPVDSTLATSVTRPLSSCPCRVPRSGKRHWKCTVRME